MDKKTVFIFTSYGMGQTDDTSLRISLSKKFLALVAQHNPLPAQICFYTDGVRLTVEGSPVLDELKALQGKGVELVICSTCVDTFGLRDKVRVGVVGGMPDIITAITQADNTITL
jgi:sulfur relay (sulfurtransferase) complex TusBCD TusD component (DsrE family)